MARGLALVCVAAASITALVVLGSTFAAGEDNAAALVRQLPTNGAFSNVELEKRIAGLGAAALPALEHELRPGIRFIYNASRAELTICDSLNTLRSLGEPVRDLVEEAARTAAGNHAKVLDMALARFGDQKRLAKVIEHLTASDSPTVRYCAAMTLRIVGDKSSIPALRKALRDPYQRQDGSCTRIGDGMIRPVRVVAADALINLGEDPRRVWAEARK